MTVTITIPTTYNGSAELTGDQYGPFLVRRNITVLELDFDEWPCWSVTHIKTGMRFPWVFMTEEAAIAFSRDVLPVMPWTEVEATINPTNSHTPVWGMNEPTKEQKDAVREWALKRGGFRVHVKTMLEVAVSSAHRSPQE